MKRTPTISIPKTMRTTSAMRSFDMVGVNVESSLFESLLRATIFCSAGMVAFVQLSIFSKVASNGFKNHFGESRRCRIKMNAKEPR